MNILTLNGKGADATATSTVNIATSSSTWTLDGTTPTVNLNGVNGIRLLNYNVAANISLAQTNTLFTGNGTAGFTFSGVISGTSASNGITKSGTSTLRLTNTSNSFSGDVMVNTGILDAHRGALGTTAGKTYVNSTGSTTTGGQLSINQNGVLYDEAESVVIQGTGSPANGTGTAALRFGGSAGSATTFSNMNGAITLDGNANYKIDVYLQPTHWKINGGITRTGSNTGTLFLDLNHYQLATPVRLTINSTIDNNGGAVTLLGNSAGILQMDTAGHDIGAFTINGEYAPTYQTILKLGISNALATNQNLTITKGTFDLGGFNQTVNALSGVASVSLITNSGSADSKLTIGNGGGGTTFAGVIQDGATHKTALEKTGIGSATLTGANTYAGATTITGGTLAISGAGAIANSSTIQINSSTTLSVTGLSAGTFTVGSAQTLAGGGTILATGKTVVANGTLSPGSSPGTLTQDGGILQLGVGGDLNWQVHNASGVAGTGYDTINLINGATLDLSLLSAGNTYNINLWSLSGIGPDVNGNATSFNNTLDYTWTLLSTGSEITGFSTDKFTINTDAFNGTTGFSNDLGGGSFSVGLADGNTDLVLHFTAIPEPGAALLGGLGLLALLRRRR
jgi:fibronectin-binding autotransporter adhesin